jgi:hypothetical protein
LPGIHKHVRSFFSLWPDDSKPTNVTYEEAAMEYQRLAVTKRVGKWGSVYIIGGTEVDGETLPAEQADDLIARFEHEQALFGRALSRAVEVGGAATAPIHA